MKNKSAKNLPQDKDRHLDVPAEANRDRHHNYLADNEAETSDNDRELTERQKQWKKGLEEGRNARNKA
jgi:hypothetical protein